MKLLLAVLAASLPLLAAGCGTGERIPADQAATPTGPCRDDEDFINGRCQPRIPGDQRPPVPHLETPGAR